MNVLIFITSDLSVILGVCRGLKFIRCLKIYRPQLRYLRIPFSFRAGGPCCMFYCFSMTAMCIAITKALKPFHVGIIIHVFQA